MNLQFKMKLVTRLLEKNAVTFWPTQYMHMCVLNDFQSKCREYISFSVIPLCIRLSLSLSLSAIRGNVFFLYFCRRFTRYLHICICETLVMCRSRMRERASPHLPYFQDRRKKCSARYQTTNSMNLSSVSRVFRTFSSSNRRTTYSPVHSLKLFGKLFFTRMIERRKCTIRGCNSFGTIRQLE